MLTLRLAKIACIAALGLYAALVAFGSVSDYWTNFAFVSHVLDMDQLPAGSSIRWRAITSVTLHHATYLLIIGGEIMIAVLAFGALL
jgi:predicted small integral membrane protein